MDSILIINIDRICGIIRKNPIYPVDPVRGEIFKKNPFPNKDIRDAGSA